MWSAPCAWLRPFCRWDAGRHEGRLAFVSSEAGQRVGGAPGRRIRLHHLENGAQHAGAVHVPHALPHGIHVPPVPPGWVRSYMSGKKSTAGNFEPEETAAVAYCQFTADREAEGRARHDRRQRRDVAVLTGGKRDEQNCTLMETGRPAVREAGRFAAHGDKVYLGVPAVPQLRDENADTLCSTRSCRKASRPR